MWALWLPWGGEVLRGTHYGCSGRGGECGPSASARGGLSMPPRWLGLWAAGAPGSPWRAGARLGPGLCPSSLEPEGVSRAGCGLRAWSAPLPPSVTQFKAWWHLLLGRGTQ